LIDKDRKIFTASDREVKDETIHTNMYDYPDRITKMSVAAVFGLIFHTPVGKGAHEGSGMNG
jgi:hypothetical protein